MKNQPAMSRRSSIGRFRVSVPFEWWVLAGSTWTMVGLFIDGWAHRHVPGLETFFTPWHAVLYSGLAFTGSVLAVRFVQGLRGGATWRNALPHGYLPSLLGVAIFGLSGFGDMIWHLIFGIEESVDALLSPTHLGLALGFLLILSGPLRRPAAARGAHRARFYSSLPRVLTVTYIVAVIGFFTQYAHPLVGPVATVGASSPDGSISMLHLHEVGSGLFSRVSTGLQGPHGRPEISPDGRTIAFSAAPGGQHDLYAMDRSTGEVRQLTSGPLNETNPAWSPDGATLAFIAAEGHFGDLRLVSPEGHSPTSLVEGIVDTFGTLSWHPDGGTIMFAGMVEGEHRLFVADLATGATRRLLDVPVTHEEVHGSFAPDGRKAVFASLEHGDADVYVVELGGLPRTTKVTSGPALDYFPTWLPSGDGISYTSRDGDTADVYTYDLATGVTTNVTQNPGMRDWQASWSSDGEWLAYLGSPAPATLGPMPATELLQGHGVIGILFQVLVLMAGLLFLLGRDRPAVGSVTLVLVAYGALFAFLEARTMFVPACAAAGLLGDLLLWRHRRSGAGGAYPTSIAWGVPSLLIAGYFLTLQGSDGIAWPVELWTGSVMLAAACGLAVHALLGRIETGAHASGAHPSLHREGS